ncbi:YacL family protein [Paraglaciecola arctica]|uniref:YacL family protein n=1 Tax=Paraglaciecola arctica TaxID=1128911 RepID=UPI001C0726E4|nr:YacL family protein [Paraglaciecola arctica]MBU3004581.1 YacL family protein [Paraglaciecola arctica]
MDYQFSRDFLGNPVATCELECEAFGDWLSQDIAQDTSQINLLLNIVEKLQNKQLVDYQHNGKEYHLLFDKDEVELVLNNNLIQEMSTTDDDESQELSDLHIQSGCGLADFKLLLRAWQGFVDQTV